MLKDLVIIKSIMSESEKIINSNNKMRKWKEKNIFLRNCLKFNTIENSKNPSDEWGKYNSWKWNKDSHKKGNWGLVCGKKSDCIGLDLDLYGWKDIDNHPFMKMIKELYNEDSLESWLENQKTLVVKTTSNGYHVIYKLNDNPLRNVNDKKLNIDIKTTGGYLVGAGSIVRSKVSNEWSPYEVIHNIGELQPMDEKLINWLNTNLRYSKNVKSKIDKKYKIEDVVGAGKDFQDIQQVPEEIHCKYRHNFSNRELDIILNHLPEDYITGHENWLKTATAMKYIDKTNYFLGYCIKHNKTKTKSLNDRYSKKNIKLIDESIKRDYKHFNKMFSHLLKMTDIEGAELMMDYYKYKPIIESNLSNIKVEKINIDKLGKLININKTKNYVIQSDTGTGKTTLVKKYISANPNIKIISIVSRISLGDCQYMEFNKEGIDIQNYRHWKESFSTGMNVIITIDSIMRLSYIDFSNYVIFLDEYNSLIEYLINCPNLKKVRCIVFKMLLKILKECHQVICVDADIHSISLEMLKYCNVEYDYIQNQFLHNKAVKSEEVFKYEDFIKELKELDKSMVCCDSKTDAESIFYEIVKYKCEKAGISLNIIKEKGVLEKEDNFGDKVINTFEKMLVKINNISVCLITSDTDDMIDLDSNDIVIFSPKVIYGLDSTTNRPVFCHYKEHTISPRAMVQQIARNRNIEYLKYIFYKKKFNNDIYNNIKDVEKETKSIVDLSLFELMCSKEEADLFYKLYNTIKYNEDCYNTNKFAHVKKLLQDRGFDDKSYIRPKSDIKPINELNKQTKERKYKEFETDTEKNHKINEYLDMPPYLFKENKELFLETNPLTQHFHIQSYFFKGADEWKEDIEKMESFTTDKLLGTENKLLFISKFMKECGLKSKDDLTILKQISKQKSKELYSEYKLLFRDRAKKDIDLTIPLEAEKFLSKIYKKMFGASICDRERKTIAGKKINCYSLNWEELYKHRDISAHKFEGIQRGKIDLTFGKESNLIDYSQPEYLKKLVMKEIKENKTLIIKNKYFNKLKSPDICAFLD